MSTFEQSKLYAHIGGHLVELLKSHRCFVAGGTITSLFCNRPINDIDVYFRDQDSLVSFIREAWDDNLFVVSSTKKATLIKCGNVDIQLVHFDFFDSPQAIFDTFDFTACMGCYDFATESFTLDRNFMQHNAQRIFRFNKHTAFPIVSLLRVQKYRDKGYTISKPEFIRIALACMNLNITSYAQLRDQMGGMYGVNYDKLFAEVDDETFDLDTVIDTIENLHLDDDYFKEPVGLAFEDVEELIDNIIGTTPRYVVINDWVYKITSAGTMKSVSRGTNAIPLGVELLDGRDYVNELRLYKYVEKRPDGSLYSFYDRTFEYRVGEQAIAKGDYLYFNEKPELVRSTYVNYPNSAVIEVSVDYDDFVKKTDSTVFVKRCTVIREIA